MSRWRLAADVIPPITAPMGKHWHQPSPDAVLLNETHAMCGRRFFEGLANYSATLPTGVYDGKMWRRREGEKWFLCWYGPSADDNKCSINFREIALQ